MRTCNLSTRFVFIFNILTVLVLVTYLLDLQQNIVHAKSNTAVLQDASKGNTLNEGIQFSLVSRQLLF